MRPLDLTGQRFGKLTVVRREANDKSGKTRWFCLCDCGGSTVALACNLKSGNSKSCGCGKYAGLRAEHARRTKYPTVEAYMANTTQTESGCLEWNGYIAPDGYAHSGGHLARKLFIKVHGYRPQVVMHTCDNPKCINLDHLRGGTIRENYEDMVAKGRAAWQKEKANETDT